MVTYRPRHHWCFLGKIIDFTTLYHLEMETKDVDGGRIPMHFYTNNQGSELAPAQVQSRYTVAILYVPLHQAYMNVDCWNGPPMPTPVAIAEIEIESLQYRHSPKMATSSNQ
jgi:hypothetical protein